MVWDRGRPGPENEGRWMLVFGIIEGMVAL
jgi:hypothetical protein